MMILQNLHTHSTFCDGKHTPREMVEFALAKGFSSLGFSSHSCSNRPDRIKSVWLERNEAYRREVLSLKEEYRGRLDIFLGLEVEAGIDIDFTPYDYLIGAVHLLERNGEYFEVDSSLAITEDAIARHFGGSPLDYAEAYFRAVAEMPETGRYDILAHFDLITKFEEQKHLFDENHPRYVRAALDALDGVEGKIPFFEINTGAISRGYRTTPYPAMRWLREFKRRGFGAVITTDCHNGEWLDCAYEMSAELLRSAGFTERFVLTKEGFIPTKL
ncbi:MAG: PHP domain-containing protein [Clostridia bacterium]|nr:PHP domain-containing protein [Clostridia bacterium]